MKTLQKNGADFLVCERHHLEFCHYCFCDYREMNQMFQDEVQNKRSFRKDGTSLGKGLLKAGTHVMMPDESGKVPPTPLYAIIRGVGKDMNELSASWGEMTYVIENQKSKELVRYPVQTVHQEFFTSVKLGKLLQLSSA
ncbi:hypothetical protein BC829DRAFT_364307 [Chytridium lagenaria]|nr:hypothetical protein BC829DRAFT_364307 [Chytridium lagenaria]